MSASKWESDGQLAWCWLQHGSAALMLQQADEKDAPFERDRGRDITNWPGLMRVV
jgi:hypothetical protein